ncbi:2-amino-4-hydroxy-6-hydroxymethyldihydropteridine diphosphokinase [Nosocomiicoccus ampullae]|uniref:2-amino-4-hydroxy-6-hydroxymethyldihydropteridine diphosphokinase n=1 Tax=Nosocomiicoccus ampullae TaxID=489910 RepID=A0A9Q2HF49_9STAP|nr:2-amino-4-hydroxy-6-hydroxymethyldihydropteridine diphosphokinase [Nosocomiicoccus ampullae]MBB5175888.1 2-amino-4-hydroxy-6-hydroxymethyldihydropteridine diphosphokinase [Nosocomiicoccus ampullae]QYA46777.1 2-amino-4-hydroxy-6-hydroxymethyldihydropteridine diphosphokinase [Nosocomiicoccus ampullae]
MKAKAYLGLGANIGERHENLKRAIQLLNAGPHVEVAKESSIYETAPYGKTDQPDFLNMVLEVKTDLEPIELLEFCLSVENELGRVREEVWGPRIIDIDVLMYEDLEIDIDNLIVPHEEMHLRKFVLEPLNEIAPNAVHPTFNKTVKELLDELNGDNNV